MENKPNKRPVGRPPVEFPIHLRNRPVTENLGPVQTLILMALRDKTLTTNDLLTALYMAEKQARSLRQSLGLLVGRKLVKSARIINPDTGRWILSWSLTRPGAAFVAEQRQE